MAAVRKPVARRVSLARALSKLGLASRAEAARFILSGRVTMNGRVIRAPSARCALEVDTIRLDGKKTTKPSPLYIMMNKPVGIVTTRSDEKGRPTVYHLLGDLQAWCFPVGRLDRDTSGLLLLTNDNRLGEQLTNPRSKVPKTYVVGLDRKLNKEDAARMRTGMVVGDERFLPAKVKMLEGKLVEIVLYEGKNRQIRRMCEALGYTVTELIRVRIGNLFLGDMPPGQWRRLTKKEIELIKPQRGEKR